MGHVGGLTADEIDSILKSIEATAAMLDNPNFPVKSDKQEVRIHMYVDVAKEQVETKTTNQPLPTIPPETDLKLITELSDFHLKNEMNLDLSDTEIRKKLHFVVEQRNIHFEDDWKSKISPVSSTDPVVAFVERYFPEPTGGNRKSIHVEKLKSFFESKVVNPPTRTASTFSLKSNSLPLPTTSAPHRSKSTFGKTTKAEPPFINETSAEAIGPQEKLIVPVKGYEIEHGIVWFISSYLRKSKLIDNNKYTPYYHHYFFQKEHTNFLGECENGPILVSVEIVDAKTASIQDNQEIHVRALVRSKYDDEFAFIPLKYMKKKKVIAKLIEQQSAYGDKFREIKLKEVSPGSEQELVVLEQRLLTKGYKFGVLYCKDDQTTDDEMFSNVEGSTAFEDFLKFLGTKVALKGFGGFNGGLDTKNDHTGTHSIFCRHSGYDIMFHVSTYLPFFPKDPQQVERKRHLGNDVCVIIFKDSNKTLFDPSSIKSEFNHSFMVVCPEPSLSNSDKTYYRIAFSHKNGIGNNAPLLQASVFERNNTLHSFLMTKLINAERAALTSPSFHSKLMKARQLQLQDVAVRLKIPKRALLRTLSSKGSFTEHL